MNENLTLDLSVSEINVVLGGLAELPAKNSYDLINKIKGQAESQLAPATAQPELLVEASPQAEVPQT